MLTTRTRKVFSALLTASLVAQPVVAQLHVAQAAPMAIPEAAVAMPLSFEPGPQRDDFFGELDRHLGGIERALESSPLHLPPAYLSPAGEQLTDLTQVAWYLRGQFSAPGAAPARHAARQVLLAALSRRGLRADVTGTLRYAARGGARPEREVAVAKRLAALAARVEAADPNERLSDELTSLREAFFGDAAPEAARDIAGRHLDALFDGTPPLAEGAPVYQKPGAMRDEFGRTSGWEDVLPKPAGAPRSFAEASLETPKGAAFTLSPDSWLDEVFYYVMIDRFGRHVLRDASGRVLPTTWGDPYDARTRHGGNLQGLIDQLDYLRGIATTIVVSPIVMNPPGAYHGYSSIHRLAVEPAFGTMADLQALRRELSQRGMRLIVDRVFNHTGPILEYVGGHEFGMPKDIQRVVYPLEPVDYVRDIAAIREHFSRRGDISNWDSTVQKQNGDLPGGVNRLRTENPATQELLLLEQMWWMLQTDEDGVRLDAYPHVARGFWDRLYEAGHAFAARLGKKNYLFLGELFQGDPMHYIPELIAGRLGAAYNYVSYYWNAAALHGRAPTRVLEESHRRLYDVLGGATHHLVNFLGNHDRLHWLEPGEPEGVLHFALAYIFTSIGIPYLYGEEQAPRRVPGRKWLDIEAAREDRFYEGKFTNPAFARHSFDTQSPGYRLVAKLTALRKEYAPLRRGDQYVRWSDPHGPGIFAFSRIHRGEEVLVVLNSSSERRGARMWVDAGITPPGTTLVDAMDGATAVTARPVDGGSQVGVEVPPYGVRVFVRPMRP
ncbi:MAG: hypothetical protein HY552_07295 [Elusimicrobia bacterium]|nr:hypothetical protein [Elusimicrobiota bacterium]